MKIIKIGAIWCPGCLVMKKVWKNIMGKYPGLDVTELDYDMDSLEVAKYNPGKVLPVCIFTNDDGIELARLIGEQKEEIILDKIGEFYEKDN